MIKIFCCFTAIVILMGASYAEQNKKPLLKGMELYSFIEDGKMQYSLMIGTNRCKLSEEIRSSAITYNELITEKKSLAKGETIFWGHGVPRPCVAESITFQFPEEKAIKNLRSICKQLGISLKL